MVGIGGILYSQILDIFVDVPYLGIKGLVVALVGGLESIIGAVLAGCALGILENLSGAYVDRLVGGGVSETVAYLFVFVILIIKPYGIFGLTRIERI